MNDGKGLTAVRIVLTAFILLVATIAVPVGATPTETPVNQTSTEKTDTTPDNPGQGPPNETTPPEDPPNHTSPADPHNTSTPTEAMTETETESSSDPETQEPETTEKENASAGVAAGPVVTSSPCSAWYKPQILCSIQSFIRSLQFW